MWQRGQARLLVPLHLIQFARAHAALGEWDRALGYVTEAQTLIGETGERVSLSEAASPAGLSSALERSRRIR